MKHLFYLILTIICINVSAQINISGIIKDAETNLPLSNVNVIISTLQAGSTTTDSGYFHIANVPEGKHELKIQHIGYKTKTILIKCEAGKNIKKNFYLEKDIKQFDEIVITATRNEQILANIPNKIHIINSKKIEALPMLNIDDAFKISSGINIDRPFGIFAAKSTVTMRGLSGTEQGRTLVLVDGIPVNKTDGGTVNFNMIDLEKSNKIEILKGPASALYGGNAMGGVINIISSKPEKKLEGTIYTKYSTYNTLQSGAMLRGKINLNQNFMYWGINGNYAQSEGYISTPPQEKTPYTVATFLNERNATALLGFNLKKKHNIELQMQYFDDERGSGEKVIEENGSFSEHDTYQVRSSYVGSFKDIKIHSYVYFIEEAYKKVNEYVKDNSYTLYDVDSKRRDIGFLTNVSKKFFQKHDVTIGFDLRQGSVVASDIYYTSSDKINNKGYMDFAAVYLQDVYSITEKLGLIAGVRYDYAHFYNGAFTIEKPSAAIIYMQQYEQKDLKENDWFAISTKLSLQYKIKNNIKIYGSYGKGFRPPILDDMCRSGKTRGGFQVANPNLNPETIHNYEIGSEMLIKEKLSLSPAIYYSRGKDFLYFVSTGDYVDMGYWAAILHSENVSKVEIYGTEMDINYNLNENIRLYGNYSYAHSIIIEYKPTFNQDINLKNKNLVGVPEHITTWGCQYNNKICNVSAIFRYTGERWRNDANIPDEKYMLPAKYPDYNTIDAKLWRNVHKNIMLALHIQNIADVKYTDSKGQFAPGRFITGEIKIKF